MIPICLIHYLGKCVQIIRIKNVTTRNLLISIDCIILQFNIYDLYEFICIHTQTKSILFSNNVSHRVIESWIIMKKQLEINTKLFLLLKLVTSSTHYAYHKVQIKKQLILKSGYDISRYE